MDIILFFAMFAALLVALEPHHRRTSSLPRAPFGADAELDHDLDRVLHDVPAASEHPVVVAARPRRRAVRRFAP